MPRTKRPPRTSYVLAIDPGDVHCGMAWFNAEDRCVWVEEMAPDECVDYVRNWLVKDGRHLVFEEFRLYPWLAEQQAFSEMGTAQVIGAIKTVFRWYAGPASSLTQQPASVKKPTEGIMRARGITRLAVESSAGVHCADAELHGYYYLNNPTNKGASK